MITSQDLRFAVRELREKFPTLLPVRVYVRDMAGEGDLCGDTDLVREDGQPKRFIIRIRAKMSWTMAYATLLHEWAHAVAWVESEDVEDHGPEWGLAFARIYSEMVKD